MSDIDLRDPHGRGGELPPRGHRQPRGHRGERPDAGGFLGDNGCECTDTIMVVRVDPEKKQAYILSFRDLFIPIAGTGRRRASTLLPRRDRRR